MGEIEKQLVARIDEMEKSAKAVEGHTMTYAVQSVLNGYRKLAKDIREHLGVEKLEVSTQKEEKSDGDVGSGSGEEGTS